MGDSDLDVPSLEEHPAYITQEFTMICSSTSSSSSTESSVDYRDCRFDPIPWEEESSGENELSHFLNNQPVCCTACNKMTIQDDVFKCWQCQQDVCMDTCLATHYWVEAICTHCWFKKGYMRSRFNDLLDLKKEKKPAYIEKLEQLIKPGFFWTGFQFGNPVVKAAHLKALNK